MRNWRDWPRWTWLLVGLVTGVFVGWLVTWSALGWPTPSMQESGALQGWIGSVIGVAGSAAIALGVLYLTLKSERKRFAEESWAAERRHKAEMKELRRAGIAERRHSWAKKRAEVWAALITHVRQYLAMPTDHLELEDLHLQVSALFNEWQLLTSTTDEDVVVGVAAILGTIQGSARADAAKARGLAGDMEPPARVRCRADQLIIDLGRYGAALHGEDRERRRKAFSWFEAKGSTTPWLRDDLLVTPMPPTSTGPS